MKVRFGLWLVVLISLSAILTTICLADSNGGAIPGDPDAELPGMEKTAWTGTLFDWVSNPVWGLIVLFLLG